MGPSGGREKSVRNVPVVPEPRDLVLPAELSEGAHPGVKSPGRNEGDDGREHPDIAGPLRVIVVVSPPQDGVCVPRERLPGEPGIGRLDAPLEPRASVRDRAGPSADGELARRGSRFRAGGDERLLDLLDDQDLAAAVRERRRPADDRDPRRGERGEADEVPIS